jgi:hypothetical protein
VSAFWHFFYIQSWYQLATGVIHKNNQFARHIYFRIQEASQSL